MLAVSWASQVSGGDSDGPRWVSRMECFCLQPGDLQFQKMLTLSGDIFKPAQPLPQRETLTPLSWPVNKSLRCVFSLIISVFQGSSLYRWPWNMVWNQSSPCFLSSSSQTQGTYRKSSPKSGTLKIFLTE